MMRLKLEIGEQRFIIVVDRNTPCQELLPIIRTKLSYIPSFQNIVNNYDKIEFRFGGELHQVCLYFEKY